jgi:LmbE family N-acetylglucosaminyl deacetylase
VVFFDEPDAADEIDIPAVAQRLDEILARLRPTEVYTLDEEGDRHPAHRLAGKLARGSVLTAGIAVSGGIWAYEIWGPFAAWDRLEYIDRYVAKKMAAIAEHHSQVATIPYGEGVLGLNRWRAVFADPNASAPAGEYAEVFRRIAIAPVLK